MKRMIRRYKLIIEAEMNQDFSVAASSTIQRVAGISKQYQLTEDQLIAWNDFIESVLSVITSRQFQIVQQYQSSKSYSYYIVFFPKDEAGNVLTAVEIEFRIANHSNKGLSVDQTARSPRRVIKSFVVGSTRYTSTYSVMMAVSKICDELSSGNYDILDEV